MQTLLILFLCICLKAAHVVQETEDLISSFIERYQIRVSQPHYQQINKTYPQFVKYFSSQVKIDGTDYYFYDSSCIYNNNNPTAAVDCHGNTDQWWLLQFLNSTLNNPSSLKLGSQLYISGLNLPKTCVQYYSYKITRDNLSQKLRIPKQYLRINLNDTLRLEELDINHRSKDKVTAQILKESTLVFDNCRYTHAQCAQLTLLPSHFGQRASRVPARQNKKHEQVFRSIDPENCLELLPNRILEWFGLDFKSPQSDRLDVFYRIQILSLMTIYQKQISYLKWIEENHSIEDRAGLIKQWAQDIRNILQKYTEGQYQQMWRLRGGHIRIQQDSRVGRINLFPSDYKLGVYLPIVVPLCYPFVQLVLYLNRQRKEAASPKQKDQ